MIVVSQDMGVDIKLHTKLKVKVYSSCRPSSLAPGNTKQRYPFRAPMVTVFVSGSTRPDAALGFHPPVSSL